MFFIKTGRQCCWFFLRVAELMADDRRHSVVPCVRTRDHVSEKGIGGMDVSCRGAAERYGSMFDFSRIAFHSPER